MDRLEDDKDNVTRYSLELNNLQGNHDKIIHLVKAADKSLEDLDIKCREGDDVFLPSVFDALKVERSMIKNIYIYGPVDVDIFIDAMGRYLKNNDYTQFLYIQRSAANLKNNVVSSRHLDVLAGNLKGNTTFMSLLCAFDLKDKHFCSSFQNLMEVSAISELWDDSDALWKYNGNMFFKCIVKNILKYKRSSLALISRRINKSTVGYLDALITEFKCDSLKIMKISIADPTPYCTRELLISIALFSSSLQLLDMCHCELGDGDIDIICECVEKNPCLERLILRENNLTDEGVTGLCEGLLGNVSLNEIDIFFNAYSVSCVSSIVDFIKKSNIKKFSVELPLADFRDAALEIDAACGIPLEERCIPLKSKTKSAAKIMKV